MDGWSAPLLFAYNKIRSPCDDAEFSNTGDRQWIIIVQEETGSIGRSIQSLSI